ncbi:hypothetical protein L9F63_022889, partial [Diploptera punctata]
DTSFPNQLRYFPWSLRLRFHRFVIQNNKFEITINIVAIRFVGRNQQFKTINFVGM